MNSDDYYDDEPGEAESGDPHQGGYPEQIPPEPDTVYLNHDEWVRDWLLNSWIPKREALNGNRIAWCRKWWLHPEAVNRIESLWRAWEQLRYEGPLGPSMWWRDHFDHHWPILTDPDGPFEACTGGTHGQPAAPLEAEPNIVSYDYVEFMSSPE